MHLINLKIKKICTLKLLFQFITREKIITLLDLFEKNIKVKFRVLLCYDHETDNIFQFTYYFKNFNFETILVNTTMDN